MPAEPIDELFREHFGYEVTMLHSAHQMLTKTQAEPKTIEEKTIKNALIESYCIHARSLIDFFRGKDGSFVSKCVDSSYKAFPRGKIRKALITKLHTQIAHLTQMRKSASADKIDDCDRLELLNAIRDELENFRSHLLPELSRHWPSVPGAGSQAESRPCPTNSILITDTKPI